MATFNGFEQFAGGWEENARLAWDTLQMKPTKGIATWMVHFMDIQFVEKFGGHRPGDFKGDPDGVYIDFQRRAGVCFIDQYLASNLFSMGEAGFEDSTERSATTGAQEIVLDGLRIDSPEAVAEHLERFEFPRLKQEIQSFNPDDPAFLRNLMADEREMQKQFGNNLLKVPYNYQSFPRFRYGAYGYANYFMAYALFPEVMERDFALQADLGVLHNRAFARAIVEGDLPRLIRLDSDMADSRGTLVDIRSLDRIWFPHFARAVQPFLNAGVRLIWHCDGNLMAMAPRLLDAGVSGFQGFQYEDGMDYERICSMKDREGKSLFIIAGVSVTRTLPFGAREDVVNELKWLVEKGPQCGLALGASSSITPGTSRENVLALIEGLNYYRVHGRG